MAKIISLIVIILALGLGALTLHIVEALIFCGLVMICRGLNAIQIEIFALRNAIGDKDALPIQ
jgi:hypothetical protein